MSSTICEEFIEIMGSTVLSVIITELKEAKYFSLSVDSTPDLCHVDQLTVIVRYVNKPSHNIQERFLLLFTYPESYTADTGEFLATTAVQFLEKHSIDIMYMCYDNSANISMSGKYNGMQAKLCDINPLALYVPCAVHSLNLIGVCAVESCVEATNFFSLVQKLFTFFSASTSRWGILVQYLERVLKCLSDTRWSARAEATIALSEGYDNIRAALLHIVQDPEQRADTQQEANGLHISLSYLHGHCFHGCILEYHFGKVQQS